MIHVDTSVVLAELLGEDRIPQPGFWDEPLFSSRLLVYEIWGRLNARNLVATHGDATDRPLSRVRLVELSPLVLERALTPFPVPGADARRTPPRHAGLARAFGAPPERGGVRCPPSRRCLGAWVRATPALGLTTGGRGPWPRAAR